jgi:1,4-dihydroxy-2-naphthoate octaprenyltransferase
MTEQQQISRSQAWLESLRPKTLPLAFAAIIVGTALAWWQGFFNPLVALLALITAGLLQILSNLANDYGDAVKGSDKPDRIGPLRGMQKGVITQQQMKRALIVTVVLICLSVWPWLLWPVTRWRILSASWCSAACRSSPQSPTP